MKPAKNIQVIDGAENCRYSIFSTNEEAFQQLFPGGQDIEFADELFARLGEERARVLLGELWKHPIPKPDVRGVHGTLFYGLDEKKKYYPTRRDADMIANPRSTST